MIGKPESKAKLEGTESEAKRRSEGTERSPFKRLREPKPNRNTGTVKAKPERKVRMSEAKFIAKIKGKRSEANTKSVKTSKRSLYERQANTNKIGKGPNR